MYRLKGERSISGAYHLLHGKRSAQTVQDAALFQVQPLFGICKEMTGPTLNQLTQTIQASAYVKEDEALFNLLNRVLLISSNGFIHMTTSKKLMDGNMH